MIRMTRQRVLLLALAAQILWLGLQVHRSLGRWEADRILKAVEASTAQALVTRRAAPASLLHNAEELTRAERLAPASASIRLVKGSQYLLLGRNEPAIAAYEEALRLEPRPETYLNLGRAQWRAHRETAALENLRRAVRLDPGLLREVPAEAAALLQASEAGSPAVDGGDPGASAPSGEESGDHP